MITDEEIRALWEQSTEFKIGDKGESCVNVYNFARAIYQLGRQHQRESDAELCNKEYWIMKETESAHHRHSVEPFIPENYGFDVGMMRKLHDKSEAILNNKDE